jgi:hypothetical protein
VAANAPRLLEAELKAQDRSPVVREQMHDIDLEGVEQPHDVLEQPLTPVPVSGRFGPAGASQVRHDQPVLGLESGNDVAPLPPVLRESVEEQHGLPATGLGDVHRKSVDIDETVRDPVEVWTMGSISRHGERLLRS